MYGVSIGYDVVITLEEDRDIQLVPFDVIICTTGVTSPTILETKGQSRWKMLLRF